MNLLSLMTVLLAAETGSEPYLNKNLSHQDRFAALVRMNESSLIHYVSRLKGSMAAEAEDFVQETFLRFHHKVKTDGWDSVASPSNWLYRVAHNLVMDAGRRKKLEKLHREEAIQEANKEIENTEANSQLDQMIHHEASKKAMALLQRLPEEDREVVLLKVIQGMTLKEISEITGENIGKTAYRINRSLEVLAGFMKDSGLV